MGGERILPGTLFAPRFSFRVDNASHQGGYHIHLLEFHHKKWRLTNICFTRIDRKVFAYVHNEGKAHVHYHLHRVGRNKFIKELKNCGLKEEISKHKEWTIAIPEERELIMKI